MTKTKFKYAIVVPLLHVIALGGLFIVSNWWLTLVLGIALYYPIQLLGHNAGSHKLFSHRSFVPNAWYPYVAAYFNFLSLHGSPSTSALIHRLHHRYADTDLDPSNANRGRWYAYMGWMIEYKIDTKHAFIIRDLARDFPWLLKIDKYDLLIALSSYLAAFLISFDFGIALLIGSLLAFQAPLLVNCFLHKTVHGTSTEPVNNSFVAKWINPIANHATHHNNPSSFDFSNENARDFSAVLIRVFLQKSRTTP